MSAESRAKQVGLHSLLTQSRPHEELIDLYPFQIEQEVLSSEWLVGVQRYFFCCRISNKNLESPTIFHPASKR